MMMALNYPEMPSNNEKTINARNVSDWKTYLCFMIEPLEKIHVKAANEVVATISFDNNKIKNITYHPNYKNMLITDEKSPVWFVGTNPVEDNFDQVYKKIYYHKNQDNLCRMDLYALQKASFIDDQYEKENLFQFMKTWFPWPASTSTQEKFVSILEA